MTNSSTERPNFFEGQYLGAEDLAALVEYFRTQDARQILGHHTWGIAFGLDLAEVQAPDGTLEVFVQPGVAFDGYGRLVTVLARTKLDAGQFFGATSGEVEVWIRYAESGRQGVRKGFKVCSTDDVFSRINESFAIEVGPKTSILDRQSGVLVNGETVVDARETLRQGDDTAPLLCDGSIPHQDFPADEDEARWLIHLGLVRWQGGIPGAFQPLTDEQKVRSRRKRRYVGVVAESLYANDGIIRLRKRHTAFDATKTTDTLCDGTALKGTDFYTQDNELIARELLWLEGNVRITGDTRLFGGRLEFRDGDGRDYIGRTVDGDSITPITPLLIQRNNDNGKNGVDLQILIGESDDGSDAGSNRLSIGQASVRGDDLPDLKITPTDHVVIQDDGKVGIGAVNTNLESPLTIRGIGDQDELVSFEDDTGQRLWHIDMGSNKDSLNFVETAADASRLFVEAGGNVGLGTETPTAHLHIKGDDPNLFLDINGSSPNNSTELRLGSDGTIHSNIFWSKKTSKTYINNEGTNAIVVDQQKVGLGTDNPATTLHLASGSDANLSDTSGYLVIGSVTGRNMAFDADEIQARNNNSKSALFVQAEGGDFAVHGLGETGLGETRVIVKDNGQVGIGTNTPTEKLDVRGDIKLGGDGELFASGGVENLRIIVGQVDSEGNKVRGDGFSSTRFPPPPLPRSPGRYIVSFSSHFANPPVVVVSPVQTDDNVASVHAITTDSVQVHIEDVAGESQGPQNADFTFIAMGKR